MREIIFENVLRVALKIARARVHAYVHVYACEALKSFIEHWT